MARLLKIRRGTTAQHSTFTGALGEVTMDTDKKTLVAHDGTTAGGSPLAKETATIAKTGTTGSAAVPSGTTAQRDGTPAAGYFRYNTTLSQFEGYNGTSWGSVGGAGATGGGTDKVFLENDQTITTNYTLSAGKNAGTFGPVTINSGVSVTVPSGAVWTVV